MIEVQRNTFDWGDLEDSAEVQIGKILADEILANLEDELGRPLSVDHVLPIRVLEIPDAA
jgi:hypothetical protein